MGNLTNNFSRKEFACKCGCGFDTIDYELLNAIQHCVDRFTSSFNKPITVVINCGCRCKKHNDDLRALFKTSNGAQGEDTAVESQHQYGRASDLRFFVDKVQIPPKDVANFFDANYKRFGIGVYSTFTHVDSRTNGPARW